MFVFCQQVVVGSLKRQPVTPGEEDQFGILVTATSPNSSVVGIREGQTPSACHTGTLVRPHAHPHHPQPASYPHVPAAAVGPVAAARSLGTPLGPPLGAPLGPHDDPRRLSRVMHEDPGGPMGGLGPGGPVSGHSPGCMAQMGPPMTTIIGSGGGVLNRIRNNNGKYAGST